ARQPRFRWLISSDERGGLQTAYQVLVASDLKKLQSDIADKWDSGKIISDNSVEVVYGGVPLASKETLFWKVRVWDQLGRPTSYSVPASFETGLLNASEWTGKWIGGNKETSSPMFRRDILISRPVKR